MISTHHDCVTRTLLERNAAHWPERVALVFDTGPTWTWSALLAEVRLYAANLQRLGVQQDERVLSWLPNEPLAVLMLLALNYIGAVYVPVNTAYRGRLLQHVLDNVGARLLVADGRLLERLVGSDTGTLRTVIITGPERPALPGLKLLSDSELRHASATLQALPRAPRGCDTHAVIFTSGTTGPSKGVLCSYIHTATAAREFRHIGPDDRSLVALPMFHVGGVLGMFFALVHGGSSAFVARFRTDSFWDTVRRLDITTVGLLGAMVQFLMRQPVRADEHAHPVRSAVIAPLTDEALAFQARFGVDVYTEFNMTELSVPLFCGPNPSQRGTCGRPRPGLELRLVDSEDFPVSQGQVGELILRADTPWSLSHGYLNDAAATARAWRNGWFHTGDLFYRDTDDNYFFVDRIKDMIRRRGENISSYDVEAELLAFPAIREAAVVAVPGAGGEDEVLAVLVPQTDTELDPVALLTFLQPRLPHFMLPRYIRCVSQLPRTPSQKVEKHVLRAEGLTSTTWDREQAGIHIRGQHLDLRQNP